MLIKDYTSNYNTKIVLRVMKERSTMLFDNRGICPGQKCLRSLPKEVTTGLRSKERVGVNKAKRGQHVQKL